MRFKLPTSKLIFVWHNIPDLEGGDKSQSNPGPGHNPDPQEVFLRTDSSPRGGGRDRTDDLGIKNPLLYQLSYAT